MSSFFYFFSSFSHSFSPNISRNRHYPPNDSSLSLSPLLFPVFHLLLLLTSLPTSSGLPAKDSGARTSSEAPLAKYVLQNVFQHKDQCFKDSYVYIKKTDEPTGAFSVYSSTGDCSAKLRDEGQLPEKLPNCPPGLVDLDVKPVFMARSQISYPYANLNISVTAHSTVQTIVFRLECLAASDGTDVYCSNSKAMYIDGVKEWPCRAMDLSPSVTFPARFTYSCFRLTPHSTYAINATILPHRCRAAQIVTAPSFDDLFPEALVEPMEDEDLTSDPFWAPLLSADVTDDAGVWIRVGKAEAASCEKIMINVYREDPENSSKISFVKTLEVLCPDDGVLWDNLIAGKYLITAYVPIRGCRFLCESGGDKSCRQCLRTHLNVVISENKASFTWLAYQKILESEMAIFIGSVITLALTVIGGLIGLAFCYWKRRKEANRVTEIPLRTFVQAMVVYADDHPEHLGVIRVLVDCLRHCATCEPIFDMEKLITAEAIVPSRWLIDQVSNLPKFVIVMSDCAVKILDTAASTTHRLVQNRPFADQFEPAMEMIIRDALHGGPTARNKYAIVRLPYSPPVPANLGVLGLQVFNLPDQFANLVAFIHDVPAENASFNQILSQHRLQEWTRAVNLVNMYAEEYPDWLEGRWRPKEEPAGAFQSSASRRPMPLRTHQDRVKASKKLGLHAPGPDSDEEEGPSDETTFMLYAKRKEGEDDSDSDSEDTEESDTKTLKAPSSTESKSPSPNNTAIFLGPGSPPGTLNMPATSSEVPTTSSEAQNQNGPSTSSEVPTTSSEAQNQNEPSTSPEVPTTTSEAQNQNGPSTSSEAPATSSQTQNPTQPSTSSEQ